MKRVKGEKRDRTHTRGLPTEFLDELLFNLWELLFIRPLISESRFASQQEWAQEIRLLRTDLERDSSGIREFSIDF